MFIFSEEQLRLLLGNPIFKKNSLMIDVGAGDGNVTSRAARFFDVVVATEVSTPMLMRLACRGFCAVKCEELRSTAFGEGCYDAVFLLNLLDRVSRPTEVLLNAKKMLAPDGLLVIGLVLPFCPFVESGTKKLPPEETLEGMRGGFCCEGASFERSLEKFVLDVLAPLGLGLVRWTKLPYLCAGDSIKPFYLLNDAILVLRMRAWMQKSPGRRPSFARLCLHKK